MLRRPVHLALAFMGIVLVGVALTAHLTGLDPEGNWGPARRQVLGAGLVALGAAAAVWLQPALRQAVGRGLAGLRAIARRVSQSRGGRPILDPLRRVHQRSGGLAVRMRGALAGSAIGRWAPARPGRPAQLAAGLAFFAWPSRSHSGSSASASGPTGRR